MKLRRPLVSFLVFLHIAGLTERVSAADATDYAAFRQPGEFEPQAAVWLSADGESPEFKVATAEMAKALLGHVQVKMIVETEAALAAAKTDLRAKGVDIDRIEFLVSPLDTYFMRDAAVYLVNDRGDIVLLDLKWSDYGLPVWGQRLYPHEPARAAKVAAQVNSAADGMEAVLAAPLKATLILTSLFLENATFEVNGRGVLLISEPLALERNPGLTREQIETQLRAIPGVKKVIWLADGVAEDPEEISTIEGNYVGMGAGGHTDESRAPRGCIHDFPGLGRRVRSERSSGPAAQRGAYGEELRHPRARHRSGREALSRRQGAATSRSPRTAQASRQGRPDEHVSQYHLPRLRRAERRRRSDPVAAGTYLNFLIANDVVLVPSYAQDGTDPAVEKRVARGFSSDALPRPHDQVHSLHAAQFPRRRNPLRHPLRAKTLRGFRPPRHTDSGPQALGARRIRRRKSGAGVGLCGSTAVYFMKLSISDLLVPAIIVGALGFWGYNNWSDHLTRNQAELAKQTEAAEYQRSVGALATSHGATPALTDRLAQGGHVYTYKVQNALLAGTGRAVIIGVVVVDIEKREGAYVLHLDDAGASTVTIRYILECDAAVVQRDRRQQRAGAERDGCGDHHVGRKSGV